MNLKSEGVSRCAYAYLVLPTVIFFLGWLRWELGVPAAIAVLVALWFMFRRRGDDGVTLEPLVEPDREVRLSSLVVGIFVLCVIVWCVLAGQGGFVVQTGDWNFRNATFRDLITHEWPVRYDEWNRSLVYYVGHWLVAALVGKVVLAVSGNLAYAWRIGNIALLIWTATGVMLVLAQLLLLLKARSVRRQIATLMLLMLWGGLDAIGAFTLNVKQMLAGSTPENSWWNFGYNWNMVKFMCISNSTSLFYVFHQVVSAWVAILLVARRVRLSETAFLIALLLICSPLPAIGVAFAVGVLILFHVCVRNHKFSGVLRDAVSLPNLVAVFVIVPLVASFLCSNPVAGHFSFAWTFLGKRLFLMRWILFFVCELGLYFALTFERCHRSPWWWSALVWLLFCPIVKLDGGADFCMRAPIPLFLVLSVFVFVTTVHYIGVHSWKWIALVVCLAIGSYVTTKEMIWTLYHCSRLGFGVVINDKIVTFDQDLESRFAEEYNWPGIGDWITSRCNVKDPDKLFFYKWLARRQVPPSHDYAIDARGQGK